MTSAIEIHAHLLELEAAARAYVGAAVTEIATFGAELSGPRVG